MQVIEMTYVYAGADQGSHSVQIERSIGCGGGVQLSQQPPFASAAPGATAQPPHLSIRVVVLADNRSQGAGLWNAWKVGSCGRHCVQLYKG